MEILTVIIVVILIFIIISGKSGVGIKSSLIKEIHKQYYGGISAPSKIYPSISLEEAYNILKEYDANNHHAGNNSYSFWALVNNEPCFISVERIPCKRTGIKLLVTRAVDHNALLKFSGMKEDKIPNNLLSIY
ncbi:hypothetical protein EDC45_1907 [Mesocricetibacter intestinalis]|uniref:Uncharacterized protein n=1 Tax=Mesocricetibacter intestinalis TaxID=1521930 RepID=A0A4R6V6B8_9PAST|nr:hypothetical protein [Mesocricetibacter intestinalis]TDQ56502.1 hypothetical protein EDC45_1907 [Mesocricetibacter intestinalis]